MHNFFSPQFSLQKQIAAHSSRIIALTGQIIKGTNNYRPVLKMQMLSPAESSTRNVCELRTDKGKRFTLRRVMSCTVR